MSSNESLREPRYRISASVTAKGIYQIEGTVEMTKLRQAMSDPKDVSVITEKTIGQILLEMIKDAEDRFKSDGRKLAGDNNE